MKVGKPQLPVKTFTYLIHSNQSIDNVIINNSSKSTLTGSYYIYPAQPLNIIGDNTISEFIEPDLTPTAASL